MDIKVVFLRQKHTLQQIYIAMKNTFSHEIVSGNNSSIILYQSEDGQTHVDVRMENDTVWLTQAQMAELFETDRTSIVRHINNIYKTEELEREATCAKIAQVQMEGNRTVTRQIPFFNLDMIISVGYRVNAKRGVKFRQWANRILKQYLIKGYAINQNLKLERYNELKNVVQLMARAISLQESVSNNEYDGLFHVISDYVYAASGLPTRRTIPSRAA